MIDIITSFFLVVVHFIIYLFSTGEDKKKAKANLKEVVTGPNGKILLTVAVVFGIASIFFINMINDFDYEPPSNPNTRNDRTPLNCAHYGGEWDTGGLFGEAKCVYNKTDESDNK
ncbi:hypothetical protein M3Y14_32880 (plasmid) [Bacillus thuringiensis]|uniref:hypothetical protein n=1 Tax=Bacillus thuringiensis TaxID=1428 RepID=UPI0022246D9E|nr:hypothetical protein [Bacillus thuringiensis]UYX55831.1 hypothetical protein M3Y14_32880 [Bacillus thuringiensis]